MSLVALDASAVADLIARFDDSGLVAKGAVFVLGFDAIRDRSGGRWAMRADTVREFVERQFQKYFSSADHLLRLDDVNFLVVQPLESGFGAQARALKLLADVLQFFLGASAKADVKLSRVTRIGPEGVEIAGVEVSDVDLARMATMDWGGGPLAPAENGVAAQRPVAVSTGPIMSVVEVAKTMPKVTVTGDRTYEALFFVEPIWSIKQRAVVSYLLRPLIFELEAGRFVDANLATASPGDLMRLNLLVLAEAQRLFQQQGTDTRFALHVPINHASLAMSGTRDTLLAILQRFQPAASTCIVVVLTGLESGAPHSRIVALTSALANRCRAVVAVAPNLDFKIDRWRDARLAGVAVDLSPLVDANERLNVKRMSKFAARLPGVAPALMAYSAPNTAVLLAAWAAGFTHVGGELIDRYSDGMLQPLRLDPIDLYRDGG